MLGLLAGPIITLLVGFLKRIPFVANNPKIAAAILAAIATVVSVLPGVGGPIADIIRQLATQIGQWAAAAATAAAVAAVAIGTHEVVGPAIRATGLDPTTSAPSTPQQPRNPLQGT
jgi:hypothetical protein